MLSPVAVPPSTVTADIAAVLVKVIASAPVPPVTETNAELIVSALLPSANAIVSAPPLPVTVVAVRVLVKVIASIPVPPATEIPSVS